MNEVRLVHAKFIWTESHSKRIKVKLKVQKEVLNGAILEQTCTVEYLVQDQMRESCTRVEANPDQWVAAVQLRQHVSHRRTFFYLEQLILRHDAALVEYIVLDVEIVAAEVNVSGSKYGLADAQVARVSDFGKNDTILNSYEEKRQRKRGKPRAWKLKSLGMEVDDTTTKGRNEEEKRDSEYEQFLRDLEENPEMRFNISLYRNEEYQPSEMASVTDGEDLPSVPLDELLADLDLSDEEDGESSMRE
ncbi:hypothetical protein RHMOL_Rhmol08G0024200 [Rhododendron molle]|uniref:Uncharacterized protein n=1 Tax=Rhododendron molle TaxID=49168 RepID=A0ACC0MJ87_RHOML|nr:hypothetical protein RHMOL_Rhmol08G0024200 [Rhododendron molle]